MITGITFLGAAGLGLALVLGGMLLGFADADVDQGDADADLDVGAGLSLLSVTGLGALLVGFGLFGYAVPLLGGPAPWGFPVGILGAVLCFRATAWIRKTLIRTLETGTSAGEKDLVFQPATVTVAVPASGRGRGQVVVRKGDKTFYVSARSQVDRELSVGEQVVITESDDGVYTVDLLKV